MTTDTTAELEFETIRFVDSKDAVKIFFLKNYQTEIAKDDLEQIGNFNIENNKITFEAEQSKAEKKFNHLLSESFKNLKNAITGNSTIYVHQNSGIPLMGNLALGIVDKGSSMIEIKPLTGCNINCIFCSVDEGIDSRKNVDYVIEKDYLVSEFEQLMNYKRKHHKKKDSPFFMDVFINPHGEPLLYADIVELVKGISSIDDVRTISMMTNGTMLTKNLIDELSEVGLNQLNVSINAFDPEEARKLAGTERHSIKHVLDMTNYASGKMPVIIAPVWLSGINDKQIEKLIEFTKKLNEKGNTQIMIQNFMSNKAGRNPTKELPIDDFKQKIKSLEEKYDIDLSGHSIDIIKTTEYPLPFEKDNKIKAHIIAPGRTNKEIIATASGRLITVYGCNKDSGTVKIKLLRSKHNIFTGTCI